MTYKMVRQNLIGNKVVSLTTIFFIAAASLLLSLVSILSINLTGAVGRLMEDSKTPHFMQMHSGALDTAGLKTFAETNSSVDDFPPTAPRLHGLYFK